MFIFLLIFSLLGSSLQAEHEKSQLLKGVDPQGYYLSLEDGSVWEVNWTNSWTAYYWKAGEKLRIEKAENRGDDFRLSNLDQSTHIFAKPASSRAAYCQRLQEVRQYGNWIQLQNGAMWRIQKAFRDEVCSWQAGDEVELLIENDFLKKELTYIFRNLRTFSSVRVGFHQQAGRLQCPRIEDLFWSSIRLNDGSEWAYTRMWEYIPNRWGWAKGDRVTIFPILGDPDQFILFNYDAHYYSFAAIYVTLQKAAESPPP